MCERNSAASQPLSIPQPYRLYAPAWADAPLARNPKFGSAWFFRAASWHAQKLGSMLMKSVNSNQTFEEDEDHSRTCGIAMLSHWKGVPTLGKRSEEKRLLACCHFRLAGLEASFNVENFLLNS